MNLFDPLRTRTLSDMPQLTQSVDAVPIMYLDPVSETDIELSAWVRTRDGSGFVCRSYLIGVSHLGQFMTDFIADPEAMLTKHFDWTPHRTPVKRERDPNLGTPSSTQRSGGGSAVVLSDDIF